MIVDDSLAAGLEHCKYLLLQLRWRQGITEYDQSVHATEHTWDADSNTAWRIANTSA